MFVYRLTEPIDIFDGLTPLPQWLADASPQTTQWVLQAILALADAGPDIGWDGDMRHLPSAGALPTPPAAAPFLVVQWAARTPQDVLHRLGARRNPLTGRHLVPSERTFRRVLASLDDDALDAATCGYAADVVRGEASLPIIAAADDEPAEREQRRAAARAITHPAPARLLPAAAIDGKLLHGTRTRPGRCSWPPRSPTSAE